MTNNNKSLILFFSIFIYLFFSSCSKTENQKFKEREFIPLGGIWETNIGEINLPGTVDESKLVPRNTDTLNTGQLTRLYPYEGRMKYVREIEVPVASAHKHWRLIMERTKPSTVWIDGDSIGSSSLILSPQIYNIGKLIEGKHTICIEIDNSESSVPDGIKGSHAWTNATQTNWNGVIGKFGLEGYDEILLESVKVYSNTQSNLIPVEAQIYSAQNLTAVLKIKGYTWNTDKKITLPEQEIKLDLAKGDSLYKFNISLGKEKVLWSEFDPALYKVNFSLIAENKAEDFLTLDFGVREFATKGTQFTINSLKTFLRGKHDGCVFPLTGYPPMEKDEWIRQFRISKQYGINHYRFHSWTPPKAAFEAANEVGIYMQTELPYWGALEKGDKELNHFLINEGVHILEAYADNPSFVMMALGNELGGDVDCMKEMVSVFRTLDNRPLYSFGANNFLGTAGQQKEEDFFVTCRVGGQVGSADYSKHTRSTFSFADAKDGGYMNGTYPNTYKSFAEAISDCSIPVISHENGQFQSYPDYNQISKYEGVLYPYNLEVFRKRLAENGLSHQAEDFHKATSRFAAICYKEDIEVCLRTAGLGGFQVLDLQDYPGQGSAYVGILDTFMDNKGGITAEEFRGFCSEIVPLALFQKFTWNNDEVFTADLKLFNYSSGSIEKEKLSWSLITLSDNHLIQKGTYTVNVPQGAVSEIGKIQVKLKDIEKATQLKLSLQIGEQVNSYNLWVYPRKLAGIKSSDIAETTSLTEAIRALQRGKSVLLTPNAEDIASLSVGGLFTPDYWNYAMFKNISEYLKRDVSPGTLSLLTEEAHPLFENFPTEFHTNWQWWSILRNAHPFILNHTAKDFQPIVQIIDNIERNHKLGLIFEVKVGNGKLLVNTCNLEKIQDKPEGRQLKYAMLSYMSSSKFEPKTSISEEKLKQLFSSTIEDRKIIGVKNITTYQ
ncbi:glycoside hydrolase [Dysgonomonas sp. Marseille-P4361]|uniref:glycoside hydrolase n=1 Tax=Dysgonomonas sp. Marseille-P4361 TaxID=2161820 RepID=UPI000D562CEF|nr:glycoside hydrolase [Dysgonomonas sp. Marseille-P4361]